MDAFPDRQGGDDERGSWVSPPPAEPGIQTHTQERGGRGEDAEGGLGGIGDQSAVAQLVPGAALRYVSSQMRHKVLLFPKLPPWADAGLCHCR